MNGPWNQSPSGHRHNYENDFAGVIATRLTQGYWALTPPTVPAQSSHDHQTSSLEIITFIKIDEHFGDSSLGGLHTMMSMVTSYLNGFQFIGTVR